MMHNSQEFVIGPVLKTGGRAVLAIFRRTVIKWPGGYVGCCTPVALVVVEAEECTVWQLDKSTTLQEIEGALVTISESLEPRAKCPQSCA